MWRIMLWVFLGFGLALGIQDKLSDDKANGKTTPQFNSGTTSDEELECCPMPPPVCPPCD